MTTDRRHELATQADAALVALRAGQMPDQAALDALDAVVLHWASAATMLDAVEAGYTVRYEGSGLWAAYAPCGGFGTSAPTQADAWRAAVDHLRRVTP